MAGLPGIAGEAMNDEQMAALTETEMQDPLMQLVGACPDDGHPLTPQSADAEDESVIFDACPTCGIEWERRFRDGVMVVFGP